MERCVDCGFDYDGIARDDVPGVLRSLRVEYRDTLGEIDDPVLRAHPLPDTSSALGRHTIHEGRHHLLDIDRLVAPG